MNIYKEKKEQTEAELKKVQDNIFQFQQLEQRLLGRLITLEELLTEEAVADEPDKPAE